VQVYSLGYLIDTLEPTDKLLVIDDVFDSGRSIAAFLNEELAARCRHNTPKPSAAPRSITNRAGPRSI
jgi:hypoxanthine phosphoribosyltransferase